MTTHGSAAKLARQQKEAHPEIYCPEGRCLWRTGGGRCPRHGGEVKAKPAARLPLAGESVEYRGGFGSPTYRGVATGGPCDDPTCSFVHVSQGATVGYLHHVDPGYFLSPGVATKWARVIEEKTATTK